MTARPAADYSAAGEARLRRFVESLTGGTIVRMDRQVRWRPAWFADVDRAGELLRLHLRGDREGDVNIFPDLEREAEVMRVLGEHGIRVPRIHGFCSDPPCIVMDAIPGTRDMSTAADDAERGAIAREYMAQVAAMHRLPAAPFVAKGLHLPQGAEAVALVGLDAYLPLYRRTRRRPEPMLEFVIGWLRRHAPQHRADVSFIQFDSGQFLFDAGHVTGLYDFEFSMLGDPMVDLATMRMRDSIEPLGADMPSLFRHYEACVGATIDDAVLDYHTLQFATLGTMQFTGTVAQPTPGDPHAVYLGFDLALRQVMLLAMGGLMGQPVPSQAPLPAHNGPNASLLAKLGDIVGRITPAGPIDASLQDAAAQLIEWLARADSGGDDMRRRDLDDISALLDRPFDRLDAAEAALEAHVLVADPADDVRLFQLFCAIEGRRLQLYGPTHIGHSARHVRLPPIRCHPFQENEMKAAVITERGTAPVVGDFREPEPRDGAVLIEVDTAGLGGWDVLGAYRLGVEFPCVIRGEGVGRAPDGRRVYFGERSVQPFGAWAERTLVPNEEVWDVPDEVDDKTAISMGIAATGAIVPLEQARIQPGENVLVLGATGTLGQIALQLARVMGAGKVVGAARSAEALERLKSRGFADAVVPLGGSDDVAALKDASNGGFDVVLDLVCGTPLLSALKATRWGARIMTIGTGAGRQIQLDIADLLFRTLSCIGTGQRPPADRRAIWERLLVIARDEKIAIDYVDFRFEEAAAAWAAQVAGPHAKVTARVR